MDPISDQADLSRGSLPYGGRRNLLIGWSSNRIEAEAEIEVLKAQVVANGGKVLEEGLQIAGPEGWPRMFVFWAAIVTP